MKGGGITGVHYESRMVKLVKSEMEVEMHMGSYFYWK